MLNPERQIIFDGHCHTNASPDSKATPEQQIDAAVKSGIGILAFTDHLFPHSFDSDTFTVLKKSYEAAQRYIDINEKPLVLIPGVEITRQTNHLILLGVDFDKLETFSQRKNPFDVDSVLAWANDNGVLAIAAHPAPYVIGLGEKSMKTAIDRGFVFGTEVQNHDFQKRLDRLPLSYETWKLISKKRARELGLQAFTNSDAHFPEHLGTVANRLVYQGKPVTDIMSAFAIITDKNTRWSPVVK